MPFDLTAAVAALPEEERSVVQTKIELVQNAQRRLGMEPRNDSSLTFNYARGLLEEDDVPSSVANELVIVDRIHRDTNYSLIIEDVLREIADHIRRKYRLPWVDAWDIVRFYGPTMLKLYCVKPSTQIE